MPYIGKFTEEAIQKAIDRAGEKLGDGESGLVAHVDDRDEVSISIIKRFGDTISIESAAVMDVSDGYKFDKEHLRLEANLIWKNLIWKWE